MVNGYDLATGMEIIIGRNGGKATMTTPNRTRTPEEWPPQGWPACPPPERITAAWKSILDRPERSNMTIQHVAESFHREGGRIANITCSDAPAPIREEVETLMSELASRTVCDGPIFKEEQVYGPAQLFVLTSRLTTHRSVGMMVARETPAGTVEAAFGVMHRHPDWTGMCKGLTDVAGKEVLVFCEGEDHAPDVIMAMPASLLGTVLDQSPRCRRAADLEQQGINPVIDQVLRHHGANPRFIDICNNAGRLEDILANLLEPPERSNN